MAAPAETVHEKRGKRTRVFTITQSGLNNGTVVLEIPEPLANLSIQVTGTFTPPNERVELKATNDGVVANRQSLPTQVIFSDVGLKTVSQADLGFRYYVVEVTASLADSNLVITVIAKVM